MIKSLNFAIAAAALGAIALAQTGRYVPDSNWQAPPVAAARENPLKEKEGADKGGAKLFARNCYECHGEDGRGGDRGPGLHLASVQGQSDGTLFWKITNGNAGRGMPSWSHLPEAQRWQLVLFIRTLDND